MGVPDDHRGERDVIAQANRLGSQDWEMISVVRVSGTPAWRAFSKKAVKTSVLDR
jgi:hypothetical protein